MSSAADASKQPDESTSSASTSGIAVNIKPSRFRDSDVAESGSPTWFRLLLPVAALSVALILLIALVLWLVTGIDSRPELIAFGVEQYQSPAIPVNAFAEREVAVILESPRFISRKSSETVRTPQDFDLFLLQQLQAVEHETVVLYLTMHGVSDEQGGTLLLSAASADPANGYPVAKLLDQLIRCPARNILLLLNVQHLAAHLDLGMLGNDFVADLKKEFEQLRQRQGAGSGQNAKNLWILCSADDGEQSAASPALGWSAFGLACAYGLRGGPRIEGMAENDEEVNQMISAEEFCKFIIDRVSRWASQVHQASQRPVLLKMGDNFPLVEVDTSVRAEEILALEASDSQQEAPEAEAAPPGETQDEAEAKSAEEKKEEPAKKAASSLPDRKTLTAKVQAARSSYWQARFQVDRTKQLASSPSMLLYQDVPSLTLPSRRSVDSPAPRSNAALQTLMEIWTVHHNIPEEDFIENDFGWHYFQQLILRAERLLIAGRFDEFTKVIDEQLPRALETLETMRSESHWITWSLALPGTLSEEQLEDRAQKIQAAITQPTDANLAALDAIRCVEADLLKAFAGRLRQGDAWKYPEVVQHAVQTRTQAESVAYLMHRTFYEEFGRRIEHADSIRRRGEVELLLDHPESAHMLFEQATTEYRAIQTELAIQKRQLDLVRSTTAAVPYLLRWLGGAIQSPHSPKLNETLQRFEAFVAGLEEYATSPNRALLTRLSRFAEEIRSSAIDYAENAWQQASERRITAVLEIPFLPTALRQRLLVRLLSQPPVNPLTIDTFPTVTEQLGPINPYPLAQVVGFATASESLANQFQALSPILPTGRVEFSKITPDLRHTRARLGEHFREIIYRLRVDPAQVQSSAPELSVKRFRILAAFGALQQEEPAAGNPYRQLVLNTQRREELMWQIPRATADAVALQLRAVDAPQSGTLALFGTVAPALAPSIWPPVTHLAFAVRSTEPLVLQDGQTSDWDLILQATQDVTEPTELVMDWTADSKFLQIESSEATLAQPGRLVLAIPALQAGDTVRYVLHVERTGKMDSTRPAAVTARVNVDGLIHWLSLPWTLAPATPQPAELVIRWPERGGSSQRIDLFPNQSLPLELGIRKQVATAMDLRVDFLADGRTLASTAVPSQPELVGTLPLPIPEDKLLTVHYGPLTLRLYNGDTLLEERPIDVAILDPLKFFESSAEFDSDTGKVTARVRQIENGDSLEPVSVSLGVAGLVLEQGILQAQLSPETPSAVLQAQLPADFAVTQFEAHVGIAGVERLNRYLLGLEYPQGVAIDRLDLQLESPRPGAVFLPPSGPEPPTISLRANGPGELRLQLGIDRDGNGELDATDAIAVDTYWRGRDVYTTLVADAKTKTFTVKANVTDLTLPLPANRLRGAQQILAVLQDGYATRLQFPLYYVDEAPAVTITEPLPGTAVAQGDPLNVTIKGNRQLYPAVHQLEFGFDINGNARLDEGESVLPIGADPAVPFTFGRSNVVSVALPTKELAVGTVTLLVRSVTQAEDLNDPGKPVTLVGKLQRQEVTIRPASESPQLSAMGTVSGVVLANDRGEARVRVTLAGTNLGAITDESGRFRIGNVPAGAYTVLAQSYNRRGQRTVTVQPGKESKITVYTVLR